MPSKDATGGLPPDAPVALAALILFRSLAAVSLSVGLSRGSLLGRGFFAALVLGFEKLAQVLVLAAGRLQIKDEVLD